ncbi:hypothetical protein V1478_018069, partial [Vespula squamosa]
VSNSCRRVLWKRARRSLQFLVTTSTTTTTTTTRGCKRGFHYNQENRRCREKKDRLDDFRKCKRCTGRRKRRRRRRRRRKRIRSRRACFCFATLELQIARIIIVACYWTCRVPSIRVSFL